jgi:hypothetical protein
MKGDDNLHALIISPSSEISLPLEQATKRLFPDELRNAYEFR